MAMPSAANRKSRWAVRNPALERSIRLAREGEGLAQADLAQKVGVSQNSISAYETGETVPPLEVLEAMELALKLQPGELLQHLGVTPLRADVSPDVIAAINADPHLDDTMREVVLHAYETARAMSHPPPKPKRGIRKSTK